MLAIPEAIAERWAPMWPSGSHPLRPWWRIERVDGITLDLWPPIHPARWTRCDGLHGPAPGMQQGVALARCDAELEALDILSPLPAPPPMPGQVWVWFRFEYPVGLVDPAGTAFLTHGPVIGSDNWPPADMILVSGPTPWGRDVPWAATRA